MPKFWFDTAQICLNGHLINTSTILHPERNRQYCTMCGEPTIMQCQDCNKQINGQYYQDEWAVSLPNNLPFFCHNCGKPYPWTERRIRAAQELAEEIEQVTSIEISPEEKKTLTDNIENIIKGSSQTEPSARKIKKVLTKAGEEALSAFRDLLVDITSEVAKKIIWPQ